MRSSMKYQINLSADISVPNREGKNFTYDLARTVVFAGDYSGVDLAYLNGGEIFVQAKYRNTDPDHFSIILSKDKEPEVEVMYRIDGWKTIYRFNLSPADTDALLKKIASDNGLSDPSIAFAAAPKLEPLENNIIVGYVWAAMSSRTPESNLEQTREPDQSSSFEPLTAGVKRATPR